MLLGPQILYLQEQKHHIRYHKYIDTILKPVFRSPLPPLLNFLSIKGALRSRNLFIVIRDPPQEIQAQKSESYLK